MEIFVIHLLNILKMCILNVAIYWLVFLFRIREFLSSNVGLETAILSQGFLCFPQSLQANAGKVPQIRPPPLHSTSFSVHCKSFDAIVLLKESVNNHS
jgi:hypothetical protein